MRRLARLNALSSVEQERDAALAKLNALSSSEQERLNRMASVEKERDAALARLNQAATVEQQRAAVLARLRELRAQYQAYAALVPASAASELDSPQSLSTLLQAKILVRQILDTEPVRSRYPELSATMERYFAALAAQKEADGRRAAVQELDALLARLAARRQAGRRAGVHPLPTRRRSRSPAGPVEPPGSPAAVALSIPAAPPPNQFAVMYST